MVEFVPNRIVNPDPAVQRVKGRLPKAAYSESFLDVYSSCPVLSGLELYHAIRRRFQRLDGILYRLVGHRPSMVLPPLSKDQDPLRMLSEVFSPVPGQPLRLPSSTQGRSLGPFPMRDASGAKLGHSFGWIDSNIKIAVEEMLELLDRDISFAPKIVDELLPIYSLMLRANDFHVAQSMTFNVSMFLQERMLALCFGDLYELARRARDMRSIVASESALQFLEEASIENLEQLLQLSVFVGIAWPEISGLLARGELESKASLAELDSRVRAESLWGYNDSDRVLEYLMAVKGDVVLLLDDDAESIVDLALAQKLLHVNRDLKLTAIVNKIPLSNNITLNAIELALNHRLLSGLREELSKGSRFKLRTEQQLFPSLEYDWLSPAIRSIIDEAESVYLKGINLFETFQGFALRRIYSFVVGSPTTEILTGLHMGSGVVALLEPFEAPFLYKDEWRVETLLDLRGGITGR